MKVLFDHNVPRQLRRALPGHEVRTAIEMNWAELENGDLLASGEAAGFDVMITGDKKLTYQQNLTRRKIALIVLSNNSWRVLRNNGKIVAAAVVASRQMSFQNLLIERERNPDCFSAFN